MDLSTTYMGLKLKNPLVASASPLSRNLDNLKRLEDAGIAAIVNASLFEEEITREAYESEYYATQGTESFAESLSYFPEQKEFTNIGEAYLDFVTRAKKAVKVPFIASLNGYSPGGWTGHAQKLEAAGADAIELNVYFIPTDPAVTAAIIEDNYVEILQQVKAQVKIPVAIKLSPYFSAMANMAQRLDRAGADALVLFNRFYQPDIDLEALEVVPNVNLSTAQAMRLPLRWVAILNDKVKADLAATSGIQQAADVLKMVSVGADATMLCSTLLKNGIDHVTTILNDMTQWLHAHEYESLAQMKGSMSQVSCANPKAFERANYMKALQTYAL